jgi:hypothetical protein
MFSRAISMKGVLASAVKVNKATSVVRATSSTAYRMKDPLEFEPLPEKYLNDPLDETGTFVFSI